MKRKIAAILAADAVGYSRLVAEDEEDTLARLASYRGVFGDFVTRFGGRIFNTAGDSILAEFESAVDAVRCAVDIQESLRARNLAYTPSRQMSFRIGITIGDVVERDGDLLGDGVNVAARLESVAPDGGICISRSVYEVVANKVSLEFSDRGQQYLKNIPDPVHAYTFGPDVKSKNRKRASHLASLATRYWGVFAVVTVVLAGIAGFMFIGREQSVQSVKPPPAPATRASIPEASEPSVKSADSSSPPAKSTSASPPAAQDTATSSEGRASSDACSVWPQINATKSIAEIKAFLAACQSGTYNTLARARLSELERQDVAENTVETEAERKDEPKTAKNVDVGCKRFFPAVGRTLTVPCGVEGPASSSAAKTSDPETASTPPVHDCDRLAANPHDPVRMGDGVELDQIQVEEAVRTCQRALEAYPGTARFEYQLGRAFQRKESYGEALTHFRSAADKAYAAAMNNLGLMYAQGRGVAKDDTQAVRWYRTAADKGDAIAMRRLGRVYLDGSGVAQDDAQSVRWYHKAADKGDANAMFHLGVVYENGLDGVAKDEAEAVRWFRKAADKGAAIAMARLGVMYANGRVVEKDPRQAAEWVFTGVKAGYDFSFKQMTKQFRREFQRLLRDAGVYDGPIDGSFGPSMRRAIKALPAAG